MLKTTLGLILAGAAAFGIYKYSKLTPQKKKDLREKGRDLWDKNMRTGQMFTKKRPASNI